MQGLRPVELSETGRLALHLIFIGVIVRRGLPFSCLYPLLTQQMFIMPRNSIKPRTFSPGSSGFVSNSEDNSSQIGTGLGPAPSGYGTLYDSLFENNPYRNLNYNKSSWQQLLSWLGFRTDADRFQEEAQMNALQWDAGIYQQMYQDQFNSEVAKTQRMREAGENPDLLGTGNVESASSPVEDPQGMTPGLGEEGVIEGLVSGVMSAFDMSIGIATQLMQLDGLRSEIEGRNISNASSMMDVIQQRVLGMTPAEGFKTDKDFNDWKKKVEMTLRTNYGRAFFKGSGLRRWNRSIDDFIGMLPTSKDQFEGWKGRLSSAKDYLRGRESLWDESLEVFKAINEGITSLQQDIEANSYVKTYTQQQADIESATNELQYQQDIQPGLRARAQNEEWRRKAEDEDIEATLSKHYRKLTDKLDEFSEEGGFKGILSEILLILLSNRIKMPDILSSIPLE